MTTKHPGALPAGARPLSEALRVFVPAELWSRYEQAVRDRRDISKRRAAPRIRGAGAETCRVTSEQVWDAKDFERACDSAMMKAFVAQLIAGELTAIVQRDPPLGEWQPIAAEAWRRRLHIEIVRYGLVVGGNIELRDVHIVKGDRLPPPVRTKPSGPGRPSSLKLVLENFCRRVEAEEAEDRPTSLGQEGIHQSEWLKETPAEPQMEPKTVVKNISKLFQAWKAGKNVGELYRGWNQKKDFFRAYRGWQAEQAKVRKRRQPSS